MTGNELKIEIKKLGIKQEDAAKKLGITLRTLQNWFKIDNLDANICTNVKTALGIICESTEKNPPSNSDPNIEEEYLNKEVMLNRAFDALERRDVEYAKQGDRIDRLITLMEKMVGEKVSNSDVSSGSDETQKKQVSA